VAARLRLNVLVVSNSSRPIRPPGISNVRMVLVGDSADAADDRIAEHTRPPTPRKRSALTGPTFSASALSFGGYAMVQFGRGRAGTGVSPGHRPRVRIFIPPRLTKICGASRATVSAAIVGPNISTHQSADALGFSLMMWM
jgi:hypothetical protein